MGFCTPKRAKEKRVKQRGGLPSKLKVVAGKRMLFTTETKHDS